MSSSLGCIFPLCFGGQGNLGKVPGFAAIRHYGERHGRKTELQLHPDCQKSAVGLGYACVSISPRQGLGANAAQMSLYEIASGAGNI